MKSGKRMLSLILTLILALGMACPTFAVQTYEIEEPYYAKYGISSPEKFVSITAESVIKGAQTSVGDLVTSHTFNGATVDTYCATGAATLTIGTPMAFDTIVCYAPTWGDVRENRVTGVKYNSFDTSGEVYSLSQLGVYVVELGYLNIPVKYTFAVEVTESVVSVVHAPKSFSDVASDRWSHDAIMEMVDLGMFTGTKAPDVNGVGAFDPTGTMTRAQFIAVVTRFLYAEELEAMAAGTYWYSNNYDAAVKHGIITSAEFSMDDMAAPITREEMALMAVRAVEAREITMPELADKSAIADYSTIGSYYQDFVRQAFSMGLITGYDNKGTFGPKDTLTREQGAMVAYRIVNAESVPAAEPTTQPHGSCMFLPIG